MNEEDIKILEDLFYEDESYEPNGYVEIFLHKEQQQAIENLINRNKYLEKKNDNNFNKIIEYERTLENLQKNTIWKYKIKEKIEELDKEEKRELKGMKGQDRYFIKQIYQYKRKVLEELLQEGK